MNPGTPKAIGRVAQYADMALSIPLAGLVGYGIGYALDSRWGTTWMRVAGLLVLVIAAFARMVVHILTDQKSK